MAGDWIKVEHVTPDKPEVYEIAAALDIAPEHAFGCVMIALIWADQQISDASRFCHAASVTKMVIDRKTGVTGFTQAMIDVGWMTVENDVLSFNNFDRHNGKSAKTRATASSRKKKQRENVSRECHAGSVTKTGPEKRREETIIKDESLIIDCSPEPRSTSDPPVIEIPTNRFSTTQEQCPIFQAQVDDWVATFPAVDVMQELRQARSWCLANAERRKTLKGVPAFLNRWLSKSQDRGPNHETSGRVVAHPASRGTDILGRNDTSW